REYAAFTRMRLDDHEYVIPLDAGAALGESRLDRRLFDITGLVSMGYDDARRSDIPVIATAGAPELAGARGRRELGGLVAQRLGKSEAARAWADFTAVRGRSAAGAKLWLDGRVKASLDESVPQIGAPAAWRSGYTGKGVKVAVLDTGVDAGHPDLAGKVTAAKDFTWDEDGVDRVGHGTHVASTIAGSGAASGGRYKGVAPDAELVSGKVLDGGGSGYESWIIEGMRWAAVDQDADIVSMSLGSDRPADGTDPMVQAVQELSAGDGPLFVLAAGNTGAYDSIGSPAAAPSALTVGSVTKSGEMSEFSSRGPALTDAGVKPEITAPGSDIVAARAEGTLAAQAVGSRYASLSGTSMATPHVSGAAALLAQARPELTGAQLKAALVGTAQDVDGAGVYDQGAGQVRVDRALRTALSASPVAVSAKLSWPYGDRRITRTVTYRNTGDTARELALKVNGAESVSVSPRSLTVPAGGTASATVTVDPAAVTPGRHGAWLTATGEDQPTLRTPVGVTAEAPSYTLTIDPGAVRPGVDRASTTVLVQNERTGAMDYVVLSTKAKSLRLPAGDYRLIGHVYEYDLEGSVELGRNSVVFAERLTLDGDRSYTADVSGAQPVTLGVDDPDARPTERGSVAGLLSRTPGGDQGLVSPLYTGRFATYAVPSEGIPGLTYFAAGSWQLPYVLATVTGEDAEDIPVGIMHWKRFDWDVTAEVVDAGDGTGLDALDVEGRIVLFSPGYTVPSAERAARYAALKAKNPAVILSANAWPAITPGDPVLRTDEPGPTLLRRRLAEGPVTLRIKGQRNPDAVYNTFHSVTGKVPGATHWVDSRADLAPVEHDLRTTGYPNDPKGLYAWEELDGLTVNQHLATIRAPERVRAYYIPGVPWRTATFEYALDEGALGTQYGQARVYRAGETARDHWLSAPFNPSLQQDDPAAVRDGDRLRVDVTQLSDAAGHATDRMPRLDDGETVLRADDGTLLDRVDYPGRASFDVPSDSRWYRLTATTSRDVYDWALGTRVSDEWRFRSGHAGGEQALPLIDVRYDLPLNGLNQAPVGEEFTFALALDHQHGATGTSFTRAGVEYSTDGGTTWRTAPVRRTQDATWQVTVPPLEQGFVSLRVTAQDLTGGALTETVTKAYRVGCPDDWCAYLP
ncbi:S8 family serine peptidase, partial [Streptomyces sp. NPDC051940]|uniref:S8 family serine peptidase n=1 Tax=Streptomyces sp. NPDC051940 TaxID=3155675 RepID=UPI0034290274